MIRFTFREHNPVIVIAPTLDHAMGLTDSMHSLLQLKDVRVVLRGLSIARNVEVLAFEHVKNDEVLAHARNEAPIGATVEISGRQYVTVKRSAAATALGS